MKRRNLKRFYVIAVALVATCGLALSGRAQVTNVLVNDSWADNDRTDPAPPTYADNNGQSFFDYDADSDTYGESAWFTTTNGTTVSSGHLTAPIGTSSLSLTTYFTESNTWVNLANAGDTLRVMWVFTPSSVNVSNTSQGFNIALASTPAQGRLGADGGPPGATYQGFAMYGNMGTKFNNGNSFQLRRWGLGATAGNLLAQQGNWTGLTNNVAKGTTGYASGTQYTNTWTIVRDGSGNLDVTLTMAGGNIGGTGLITDYYVDTSPSTDGAGYTFDTFGVRPSNAAQAAASLDSNYFEVDFITVPEPSTIALVVAGLGLMLGLIRRRR